MTTLLIISFYEHAVCDRGGGDKNKRKVNLFYFYFIFLKVRVGSPVKHFRKKNKRPNQPSRVAEATPTHHPTSGCNRCVVELFDGVFVLPLCFILMFCWYRHF